MEVFKCLNGTDNIKVRVSFMLAVKNVQRFHKGKYYGKNPEVGWNTKTCI